ncbi:sigma factor-like helix-turn-helix DNA-binding protein [Nocardia puris]|uniref:DNA-directed RNA polymerase specialized sigma subunit n=4 Tax=Nocardia puris TaxID=208602 RepID=A0A366DHD3_9NOCA|nr:sigma factor-like helix-turn-helix DNA-binding protein [Nocardia puris]RBO88929.1 DNA-directed RNA polymerase specialized sigma subunit [Nocardia puris]
MSSITSLWEWMPSWILSALNFGQAYPDGDEAALFELGDTWLAAAADLESLIPELRDIAAATQQFYSGAGAEAVARELDTLFEGDYSVEFLAEAIRELGEYTRRGGTEIEYTKILMAVFAAITVYSIYQLLAAYPWGQALIPVALLAGRQALATVARQGATRLAIEGAREGLRNLVRRYWKQISIGAVQLGAMGGGIDLAIQGYQVAAGHRDGGIDLAQTARMALEWGVGGLVGAPAGIAAARGLAGTALSPAARGLLAGAAGGAAGAVGGYGAGIGWQVGAQLAAGSFDWNTVDTTFSMQMLAGGVGLGAVQGMRAGLGHGRDAPHVTAQNASAPRAAAAPKPDVVTPESRAEGRSLYRDLSREAHPDRFPAGESRGRAHEFMQRVNDINGEANAPGKRNEYSERHVAALKELREEWTARTTPTDGSAARPDTAARAGAADAVVRQAQADAGARSAADAGARPAADSGTRGVAERGGHAAERSAGAPERGARADGGRPAQADRAAGPRGGAADTADGGRPGSGRPPNDPGSNLVVERAQRSAPDPELTPERHGGAAEAPARPPDRSAGAARGQDLQSHGPMADEFAGARVEFRQPDTGPRLAADTPRNCAVYGLWFGREVLGLDGVLPLSGDGEAIKSVGFAADQFARAAGGDWHRGGFASLDEAAALVRDAGATVLALVEYRGFQNRVVGAHQLTLFRSADRPGVVMVREWDGARAFEYDHLWGQRHTDVAGVYGIVFDERGRPVDPLVRGAAPTGRAGVEHSYTRVGQRPFEPLHRAELAVGTEGRRADVPVEGERVREVATAREWVVEQLREHGLRDESRLADIRLTVSELVANSLRHSSGAVRVAVLVGERDSAATVRVEITDDSPVPHAPAAFAQVPDDVVDELAPPELDALIAGLGERGRGTAIVAELADDSGVRELPGGKVTWFELWDVPGLGLDRPEPEVPPGTAIPDELQPGAAVLETGTSVQIADWLRVRHGLEVEGFDHPAVDASVVREFGSAVHDVLTRHPHISLPRIRIAELDSADTIAELRPNDNNRVRWLGLNLPFATDPRTLRDRLADQVSSGRMALGHDDRPVYSRIVHELGHALDYAGGAVARERAMDVLTQHYRDTHPGQRGGFDDWLRQLAGYSFKGEGGAFVAHEAVAEAFADVEVLGPSATEPARVLHRLLVVHAEAAAERTRRAALTDGSTPHQYPGQGAKSHLEGGVPKICAPEALGFARERLGVEAIAPQVEAAGEIALHGVSAGEFAAAAGGDWRPGGFRSLDEAAMVVRETGGVVVGVVEFLGLNRPDVVGAHAFVLFRAETGAVIVREELNGVREFVHTWGAAPPRLAGVYGIVYHADGTPAHPPDPARAYADGERPVARIGAGPAETPPAGRELLERGTNAQVARWLRDKYRDSHGLGVTGFDDPAVSPDVVRQYAAAIDDMLTKYPEVDLREVRITDDLDDPDIYGQTYWFPTGGRTGGGHTEYIAFNRRFATDPELLRRSIAEDVASGHTLPGHGARPVYSIIVHEFGHAVDAAGSGVAQRRAEAVLADRFLASRGRRRGMPYAAWLRQLSNYAFDAHGRLNPVEGVPDAFADVEVLGADAAEPAQILHRLLLAEAGLLRTAGPRQATPRRVAAPSPLARPGSVVEPRPPARPEPLPRPIRNSPPEPAPRPESVTRPEPVSEQGRTEPAGLRPDAEPGPDGLARDEDSPPRDRATGRHGEHRPGSPASMTSGWDPSEYPTAAEVGTALAARHGLTVTGFDAPGIDTEAAREYARAVHDVLSAYRWIDLREVRIGAIEQDPAPTTELEVMPARAFPPPEQDARHTESVVLNIRYARNPRLLARLWAERISAGHMAGPPDRAVYGLITHELGHALDHAGRRSARAEALFELLHLFRVTHRGDEVTGFPQWAATQLSAYSFEDDDTLDPVEALAEAFAAVRHRGAAATAAQRVLHDLLVNQAKSAARPEGGTGVDVPDVEPVVPEGQPPDYRSAAEVGRALEQRYSGRGLTVIGFDTPGVRVAEAREYARAIEELLSAFPAAPVREVRIGAVDENLYAEARYGTDADGSASARITLNASLVADPGQLREMWAADVAAGRHVGPAESPVYANVVHEFGHLLDRMSGAVTRAHAERELLRHYAADLDHVDADAFRDWLRAQFSAHAFHADGSLFAAEAVAEAFAAVRMHGRDATGGQRFLNRLLLANVDAAARDPGTTGPAATGSDGSRSGGEPRNSAGHERFRDGIHAALLSTARLSENGPYSRAIAAATPDELRRAVDSLGRDARRVVVARFWHRHPVAETAVRLRLPESAVVALQNGAVREVARFLADERGEGLSPSEAAVRAALRDDPDAVRAAIARLPRAIREFSELALLQGRSMTEIATEMDRGPSQLGQLKSRAYRTLAGLLAGARKPERGAAARTVRAALAERPDAVRAALARLRPDERRAVELGMLEGRSGAEIAAELGRTVGATEVFGRRAVRKLAELLESEPAAQAVPAEPVASSRALDAVRAARRTDPDRLRQAIATLPRAQREVAEHRFLAGRSIAETAAAMGRSDFSITRLQSRAVAAVATVLAGAEPALPAGGAALRTVRAAQRDDPAALRRALRALTTDEARVIRLRIVRERSIAETAAQMGRTEHQVNALQRRAVRRLAAELAGVREPTTAEQVAFVRAARDDHPDLLRRAIAELSGAQRAFAELRYLRDKKMVAIASALGRSADQVAGLQRRVLPKLTELLAADLGPPPRAAENTRARGELARLVEEAKRDHPDALRQAVGRLPEIERHVLELRFLRERSPAEVAEEMGRTVDAISAIQRRALRRMPDLLAEAITRDAPGRPGETAEQQLSDSALVAAIAAGNDGAPARLRARYEGEIYAMALARVGSERTAGEITAEVFDRAARGIATVDTAKVSVAEWLSAVADTLIRAHTEFGKFRQALWTVLESSGRLDRSSPHHAALAGADRADIQRAMDTLDPGLRRVLIVRFSDKHSIAGTARQLALTEDAVRVLQLGAVRGLVAALLRDAGVIGASEPATATVPRERGASPPERPGYARALDAVRSVQWADPVAFRRALALLVPAQRRLVELRLVDGLSLAETAAAMDIVLARARNLQRRAARTLVLLLADELTPPVPTTPGDGIDMAGAYGGPASPGRPAELTAGNAPGETNAAGPVDAAWDLTRYGTAAGVGRALSARHGFIVHGFDLPGVDARTAREYARALDDVLHDHPTLRIPEASIAPLPDSAFAVATHTTVAGRVRTGAIVLGQRFAVDPELFARSWAEELDSGRRVGPRDRPVYANIVHELGHALDHLGGNATRREATTTLMRHYLSTADAASYAGFERWLRGEFGSYSFTAHGDFLPAEAVAEAFAAVRHLGAGAGEGAWLLYDSLLANAARGQGPSVPGAATVLALPEEPVRPDRAAPSADPEPVERRRIRAALRGLLPGLANAVAFEHADEFERSARAAIDYLAGVDGSEFVTAALFRPLEVEVLDQLEAVDSDELERHLDDRGIAPEAAESVALRLSELVDNGTITGRFAEGRSGRTSSVTRLDPLPAGPAAEPAQGPAVPSAASDGTLPRSDEAPVGGTDVPDGRPGIPGRGARPLGPVRQPAPRPLIPVWEDGYLYELEPVLAERVREVVTAAGGRVLGTRTGLVDGPAPRVIVAEWIGSGIDDTLTEVLDAHPELARALLVPGATVEYFDARATADGQVLLDVLEAPEIWRGTVESGLWAGLRTAYWEDRDGRWRAVPRDLPADRIPRANTSAGPPATVEMGEVYRGEDSPDRPLGRRFHYFTERERAESRIVIGPDGRLYRVIDGKPFDTRSVGETGNRTEFVMDGRGNLYAYREHTAGLFAHSSFLAGANVAAAGMIHVHAGRILFLNNLSGHYLPDMTRNVEAVRWLLEQGLIPADGFELRDYNGVSWPIPWPADADADADADGTDFASASGGPRPVWRPDRFAAAALYLGDAATEGERVLDDLPVSRAAAVTAENRALADSSDELGVGPTRPDFFRPLDDDPRKDGDRTAGGDRLGREVAPEPTPAAAAAADPPRRTEHAGAQSIPHR